MRDPAGMERKIIFDQMRDLKIAYNIHQRTLFEKEGSWDESRSRTKERNIHNTVQLIQKTFIENPPIAVSFKDVRSFSITYELFRMQVNESKSTLSLK